MTKVRLSQVRKGDSLNDQLSPGAIAVVETTAADQDQMQDGVLSQLKQVIFGSTPGSWNQDFASGKVPALIASGPTPLNKWMPALVTGADNSLACATAMLGTPPLKSWVSVSVNGVEYRVGNGTKAGVPCYFSGDGGVTARATGTIVAGDFLYWNGSVAGFQLDGSDRIDFEYEAL